MINSALLEQKIEESGLIRKHIAGELGLTAYGLALKISGKNDFKSEEILKLCKLLKITSLKEKECIFFADKVD